MAELKRTERVEKAIALHLEGYNCAQSVLAAFEDAAGADRKLLLRAASDLGGGISGTHGTCGAVTGMLIALGMIRGYDEAGDLGTKKRLYGEGQELIARFNELFGTTNCHELVSSVAPALKGVENPLVTEENAKPCTVFVASAAAILDSFLEEIKD